MMKKMHRCSVQEASSYRDRDAELDQATVRDKLSEIAVSFIGSRLDECLVKRDLVSASTDKRLRAVEHWSQKRVK